jgi:hypothetical protein
MRRLVVVSLAALLQASCSSTQTEIASFVAIPEGIYRQPMEGRVDLDDAAAWDTDSEGLVRFLKAGGNQDNVEDRTWELPNAADRYGPLLALIAVAENRDVDDLTNGTYADWFNGEPLRHVVDARDEAPERTRHALADDRFWWIFYEQRDRLVGLTVVRRYDWKLEE